MKISARAWGLMLENGAKAVAKIRRGYYLKVLPLSDDYWLADAVLVAALRPELKKRKRVAARPDGEKR